MFRLQLLQVISVPAAQTKFGPKRSGFGFSNFSVIRHKTKSSGYPKALVQKCKSSKMIQKCLKSSKVQKCKSAKVQKCKSAKVLQKFLFRLSKQNQNHTSFNFAKTTLTSPKPSQSRANAGFSIRQSFLRQAIKRLQNSSGFDFG